MGGTYRCLDMYVDLKDGIGGVSLNVRGKHLEMGCKLNQTPSCCLAHVASPTTSDEPRLNEQGVGSQALAKPRKQ